MPTRNKAQLEENVRRAEARVRAAKDKIKGRRQSRRSTIASQSPQTRAIMYSLIPQTRRHLAKLAKKQKQVMAQTVSQIASAKDARQKELLKKKAERQASVLSGIVSSLKRKRERMEKGMAIPVVPPLDGQSRRESIAMPTMDAPPSSEIVAMLSRLVAGQVPRDPRETDEINFIKLYALTQRALARFINESKRRSYEQAIGQAVKETVDWDAEVILEEALSGGVLRDPAAEAVAGLVAAQAEDIIVASEDLQPDSKKIASAEALTGLLKAASAEEAKAMQDDESMQDEVIQDILLSSVPVTDEVVEQVKHKKKKRAKRNPDADTDSTPIYKQPLAWAVVAGLLLLWNSKD